MLLKLMISSNVRVHSKLRNYIQSQE